MDTHSDWTIAGCVVCGWTGQWGPASTPTLVCPNDGEKVLTFDDHPRALDLLVAARKFVRCAINYAEAAASDVPEADALIETLRAIRDADPADSLRDPHWAAKMAAQALEGVA